MDIGLSLAQAIAALVMGYMGVYMTMYPPSSDREKRTYKVGFALFSLISLVIIFWQGVRQKQEKKNAEVAQGQFQYTLDEINEGQQSLRKQLEEFSREPKSRTEENMAKAWGAASVMEPPKQVSPNRRLHQPQGRRYIDAQALGKALSPTGPMAVTIINDGTVEAGALAKQIEIGLKDANWSAGGDNIKIGDPDFFPDAVTVEVSNTKASASDRSRENAEDLIEALKRSGIDATLRYTNLEFPPNFARIKVAGR